MNTFKKVTGNLLREGTFKPILLILSLTPLGWIIAEHFIRGLGANLIERILHQTGDLALSFLLITLAATPARQITGWTWPLKLRRMAGLFTFFYASLHFLTYVAMERFFSWDIIKKDIMRPRIITGFVSFLILIPLAITSSDLALLREGIKRWQKFHRLTYLAATAGIIHYLWLVKRDRKMPLVYAAVFAVFIAYRVVHWISRKRTKH